MNKLLVACDHGGYVLKDAVLSAAKECGIETVFLGTNDDTTSVDYPSFATKLVEAMRNGQGERGVLLCGTGIGISIAANKYHGIRAAHVTDEFSAKMCVEHNNANIICMGGRITDPQTAYNITKIYLQSRYDLGSRHQRRIDMITDIEKKEGAK